MYTNGDKEEDDKLQDNEDNVNKKMFIRNIINMQNNEHFYISYNC